MKKNNKNLLFSLILFFLIVSFHSKSEVIKNKKILSLKNNEVNLRVGPSFDYPIKLKYKKKYLPVVILDKSDAWRQIKDFENNSGWIHISQLSKKKSAINMKSESLIFSRDTIYSKPIAKLEIGRLVLIKKCKIEWCKITTGNFTGWIKKNYLWGKID